ncbi:MAG: hypothetical protein PHV34_14665 [Verrucomicrobiae bacterium]|nr:hypothetical protein [Verrucomicrobiae bacterium]
MKTLSLTLAAAFLLTGCHTPPNRPVVVQVTESPDEGQQGEGRYRSIERQRDVWIAPHALDNEILQHEQIVTFVEKPQGWLIPSTLEPHAVSPPDLPLEAGEYDGSALQRQREIIQDKDRQLQRTSAELENLKNQTRQDLAQHEEKIQASARQLQETREKLNATLQKLEEIEQAEQAKRQQEQNQKKKRWWIWR